MTPHQGAGAGQAVEVRIYYHLPSLSHCASLPALTPRSTRLPSFNTAHLWPIHPFCSQDALFISTLLTSSSVVNAPLSSRPFKVQKAIKAYVAARHERSNRVLTTSNEAGELYEFNDPEAGADLAKIKAKLDVRQKWIWNWDTEGYVCLF
jgi:hypothetical protein